mmetsp:Transcript_10714/g.16396  ORF Transcript_10714/g.16396 Transcript_10714/m.16396 type:complete len:419 (+) Transcript_10714:110-1366(+)
MGLPLLRPAAFNQLKLPPSSRLMSRKLLYMFMGIGLIGLYVSSSEVVFGAGRSLKVESSKYDMVHQANTRHFKEFFVADDYDCVPVDDYDTDAAASKQGIFRSKERFIGRLGNQIWQVTNLIDMAKEVGCDYFELPPIFGTWSKKRTIGRFVTNSNKQVVANDAKDYPVRDEQCPVIDAKANAKAGFVEAPKFSSCSKTILSSYFGINETHVFDRSCPANTNYAALHVRSGDLASHAYNETTGVYQATSYGGMAHQPYPTSFYTAVVKDFVARNYNKNNGAASPPHIYVLCESMMSPTCEYFQKTAHLFQHEMQITFRAGEPLLDDLYIMMCAREAALSRGSFSSVFHLSQQLQKVHTFDWSPRKCYVPGNTVYWIADESERLQFEKSNRQWRNQEEQRHELNAYYKMTSCDDEQQQQ